ncbi:SSS family solute:Na+ symporter [Saccharopolyspora lacisalsi]|uniref:SSS family solute:Na+ symporter n=1 Tax=Halosaccharopolyspora lacisalsi TaxID=1000566 RepID=A0A839DT81_9PSEU|nr:sodium:solute symporter [Halosaccharopolyspora lacisalsi]MBA8824263.1 SSS family solute:Na+ symporter [Halosaccharopolyspora lacisalsi]
MILDYLVIASYFAGMLGVGWWGLRRSRNKEDYLVAGRRLGPVFYTGTLAAVVLGGASTIGSASLGYEYGISGLWLATMLGLGILVLSVALSRRLSRLGVYTVAEMLELRYDAAGRIISGIIMIVYDLMVAVTATLAVGTLFDVLLGIPRVPAILVGGGIVVAYTVLGGMWSITLTDLLQFVIMTVGIFVLLLPLSVANAGGVSGLRQALPASYFDIIAIGGGTIFTYFLIYFFGMLIGQDIWQRVFTARTEGVARNAGVAAGLYVAVYGTAAAVIGMAAKVLFPGLENSDDAFAAVAQSVLPAGLRGLVLAAALAALMSTASATVLAASTIAANDIYARFVPKHSESGGVTTNRVFVLGGGVVVIVTSLLVRDVVGALTIAYNLLVGGVLVPIIGALFWRRANVVGALASMTVGSLTVVGLMIVRGIEANEPVYIGLTASVVVFVVAGLLAPPTEQQQLATWEARLRGEGGTSSSAERSEHVSAE